ncbi:GGDEF domain-containing protein [Methylobacterium sp. Leaf93]|uniref:GGDEF domain-containing protein n=1 Tax=Methylobacterium sp. Leaf93 TaxID=1736249 RepID=UPI0006F92BCA|nr:GGDEF domain-containing protein [Methylobacterium sp. Leaf93]KQP16745.1 diguanylate cyclase [Methylobacterium sp. Leaf93]
MKVKPGIVPPTDHPPVGGDAFSLYDTEEAVLGKTDGMLAGLAQVAGGVQQLAEAYRRSYREQRRLVRMSDRMQLDLQKANHRLAEQQRDLQALNEALSGEIEHRTRLEAKLRHLADTDDLTGAVSRRRFMEISQREWLRYERDRIPACLLMADLDRFKRLNDEFGHAAGDAALASFVETCQRRLRKVDVIGRMGGEEFAILLTEIGADAGLAVAEDICRLVGETGVAWPGGPLALSVSIGIAAIEGTETFEQTLGRADAALYAAKHAGRGCVRPSRGPSADGPPP